MFSFFAKKMHHKPSKEGVRLLASILVCYEEITKVSYDPGNATMRLTFAVKEAVTKEDFQKFGQLVAESDATYLSLNGIKSRILNLEMESVAQVTFLHLVRDVETLTRGEISLVADLLYNKFPQTLILDERENVDPNFEIEQENTLDRALVTVRQQHLSEKLLGIREGDHVVVYNQ